MQRQGRTLEGTLGTLVRQGQACQGRLGRTQGFREGHLGVTQRDTLEKYQGTRKDAVEDIKGVGRNIREDTGDGTKEKRGSTGHKSAQRNTPWSSAATPSSARLPFTRCFRSTSSALAPEWRGVTNTRLVLGDTHNSL